MPQRLPPLNALRAFEAVARHLSFRKAAEELHVTPAAVSQQIKTLEDYLGFHLFHRIKNTLSLTEAAEAGLPRITEGLKCLVRAAKKMRDHHQAGGLTICTPPSFAAKWLVPRLPRFIDRYPDINLRILASINAVDRLITSHPSADEFFNQSAVDMHIRFGQSLKWTNCQMETLLPVTVVPLCSPRLLENKRRLRTPEDLCHHTLLHDEIAYEEGRPDWEIWLKTAGVQNIEPQRNLYFSHTLLALEAAANDQGVMLALQPLVEADLAAGRLVIPFGPVLPLPHVYYLLISSQAIARRLQIAAFQAWLFDEISGMGKQSMLPEDPKGDN